MKGDIMDTLLMFGSGFIVGFGVAVLLYRIYRRQSKTDDIHRIPTVWQSAPVQDGLAIIMPPPSPPGASVPAFIPQGPSPLAPPTARALALPPHESDHVASFRKEKEPVVRRQPDNVVPFKRRG